MPSKKLDDQYLPVLFQVSDEASLKAQKHYFFALKCYLSLLVVAALISFYFPKESWATIVSAILFLITLGVLIWLKVQRPEDIWYNGRAVAESVKTRAWRWVMKAEPYEQSVSDEQVRKEFISDLKSIFNQNKSLSGYLDWVIHNDNVISDNMTQIRNMPLDERMSIYKQERIKNQAEWYAKKSFFNRRRAKLWFVVSIILHSIAIAMLLYRIKAPNMSLPIEVVATLASAVLTWLQSKKHNELNSSYSLAAHEIILIKNEAEMISTEEEFSKFVLNSESAFSREHTQWTARKNE